MTREGALCLIPWHIGNILDVTLNAARHARRLRVFLAEEPDVSRGQFEEKLGIDCRGKRFLAIPEDEDQAFFDEVRGLLRSEDVGLIADGGAPCFIDPGAWLVRRLREDGAAVKALAGVSVFATMLSLSGVEWTKGAGGGSFVIYHGRKGREGRRLLEAVERAEPVFVFLPLKGFRDCLEFLAPALGARRVTAFFDLAKVPPSSFPCADRVEARTCAAWLEKAGRIPWSRISDVSLMIDPPERRR